MKNHSDLTLLDIVLSLLKTTLFVAAVFYKEGNLLCLALTLNCCRKKNKKNLLCFLSEPNLN